MYLSAVLFANKFEDIAMQHISHYKLFSIGSFDCIHVILQNHVFLNEYETFWKRWTKISCNILLLTLKPNV